MLYWLKKRILVFLLLFVCMGGFAFGQASCLPNIDFEQGDFTNWECFIGNATSAGGNNQLNLFASPPVPGRHTIIDASYNGVLDYYGQFPMRCPNGSAYSLKLGNNQTNAQAERVSYTFTIPNNQIEYTVLYQYAVVFQDPGHPAYQQPRFLVKVYDATTNEYIPCATYDFVATANLPGFKRSLADQSVWYKDWTPVSINLSGYAGQTITIEFTTSDCTLGGHFGYAYIDINTGCYTPVLGSYYCQGSSSVNLTAPFGYQDYYWYNSDFSQLLGTGQYLNLTPPPPAGTVVALDLVPYPGFSCRDTVLTTIQAAMPPPADAGIDKTICTGQQTSIGSPPVSNYIYHWSPSAGLSDTAIANPVASPASTTDYIVTVTDFQTTCTKKDTVRVTVNTQPSSAFSITSNSNQCFAGNNFSFAYSDSHNFPALWKFGDGDTSTSYNSVHSYASAGQYTVTLVVTNTGGCADSTTKIVNVYPTPSGSINTPSGYICEGLPTVITVSGGSTYTWYLDGNVIPAASANTFNATAAGTYTAQIITANGCRGPADNSISLTLVKKPTADFVFDKYCTGIPVNFTNLSTVANSLPVDYFWDFGNGNSSTGFSPHVTFNTAGNTTVKLSVTPQNCPALITSVQKIIAVEAPKPGMSYYPLNVIENKATQLSARDFGNNYSWSPSTWLNNPTIDSPFYNGNREQLYYIRIVSPSSCVTTDTQLVRIFKEKDIFVPKAFTPNGDGRNDKMFPFLVGLKELKVFRIVNRWGVIVFQTKNEQDGWNGTFKGAPQPMDAYTWEAEAIDFDGNIIRKKGTFTLIR
jgi:gliding motility-associated-like protein